MLKIIFSLFIIVKAIGCFAQTPLPHGHAHNDYKHVHPLTDALHYGFTSVEADVHLIDGELYVSHETPTRLKGNTLKELYLSPLAKIAKRNNGRVYKNLIGTFYLVVDIKTDAEATYKILKQQLLQFPQLAQNPNFKLYLTSFYDLHFIQADSLRLVGIDGRPDDLGKGFKVEFMPVVSQSFKKYSAWNGIGIIPPDDSNVIADLIRSAHLEGKKVRLWAIPDNKNAWKTLLELEVDFINTDKLEEFSQFSQRFCNGKNR